VAVRHASPLFLYSFRPAINPCVLYGASIEAF
ncbi:uncharacterized protein METZ01_LOCUS320609, partial [marine metagenome]